MDSYWPIHIFFVFQKVYHHALPVLLKSHWAITGLIQLGTRKGYQALELMHTIRLLVEKSTEWSRGYVLVSLDLRKAFETLSETAVIRFGEENKIPLRLELAVSREVVGPRSLAFILNDLITARVDMNSGLRQGGHDVAFIFALAINNILSKLSETWRQRGLDYCIFGPFGPFWLLPLLLLLLPLFLLLLCSTVVRRS